jgi:periplasmic copper chaperone A
MDMIRRVDLNTLRPDMRHLALILVPIALSACGSKPVEGVTDARITLPAVAGRPGAAYFTLNGGEADNRLMQVTSPQVVRVELHESMMKGGMMSMAPIEGGVAVPRGTKVQFSPGGKHAMLYDIAPATKVGGKVKLTFTYANGRTIEVDANVKASGEGGGHAH